MRSFYYRLFAFILIFIFVAIYSIDNNSLQNTKFRTFSEAKRALYFLDRNENSFYCNCAINNKHEINFESCGYTPSKKLLKRALKSEVEHIVTAHNLCSSTPEWKSGNNKCSKKGKKYKGRDCAVKYNESCLRAHNDLNNLRLSVGEINVARSNYKFAIIPGESRRFGSCDFEIENHTAEPSEKIRGEIARTYLFMDIAYPELKILTSSEKMFYIKWSNEYPVSLKECNRNEKILTLQKSNNTITRELCNHLNKK